MADRAAFLEKRLRLRPLGPLLERRSRPAAR
jgi:hypothetical protein